MISESSQSIAQRAKAIYESRYREEYERLHMHKYLCIEPESGETFLGDTLDEAINAAMDTLPDRLTFALQIGKPAAFHLGVLDL